MELEYFHTLVDPEPVVDVLAQGAADGSEETDNSGEPDGDITGSRSDTDKTGDGTFAGANEGEATAVLDVVNETPADDAERGGGVGVEDDCDTISFVLCILPSKLQDSPSIALTLADRPLPPLKPYHPNQINKVPRKTSVVLCGLLNEGVP